MKDIFESYKPKDLRAFIREHNKKVRKAVREETKEFRLKVLSKRLIDVRKKSKDEIVSIMLKNKKFFSNIKKNTEAEKEKPKKKPKTKTVKISSETQKEIEKFEKDLEEELKDPKKLAELFGDLPSKQKKKKPIKKINQGFTDKQILEAQKKADKELTEEQKKKQVARRARQAVTDDRIKAAEEKVRKRKEASKKIRNPVERARITRKYQRLEATVQLLRDTMKQYSVNEKERKFLKSLDIKLAESNVDEPELEKIKRIVIKYNNTLPKLPTQKEVGKKEAPAPAPKGVPLAKKKEAPAPKGGTSGKKKEASFKKNPDIIAYFQKDKKTQKLLLDALPLDEYEKDDQKDLAETFDDLLDRIIEEKIENQNTAAEELNDPKERILWLYMFEKNLIPRIELYTKARNQREALKNKIEEDFRKEREAIEKEREAEIEKLKKQKTFLD